VPSCRGNSSPGRVVPSTQAKLQRVFKYKDYLTFFIESDISTSTFYLNLIKYHSVCTSRVLQVGLASPWRERTTKFKHAFFKR
jgi:hypothetical protein